MLVFARVTSTVTPDFEQRLLVYSYSINSARLRGVKIFDVTVLNSTTAGTIHYKRHKIHQMEHQQ